MKLPTQNARASGARILVVEDEALIAEEIRDRLLRAWYEVVGVADSGENALASAGRTRPDLVLMDIRLKGAMDGIEAAGHIRERFDIPVVYLTAHADHATLERAKQTAPLGYLLKPFQERELLVTIEMAIHRHRLERRLKESELRYERTLASIGDGVIATDLLGRITFMNRVAEALTGWDADDARGRMAEEVFTLAHEASRTPAPNPVTEALRLHSVVHITRPLLLIGRNGTAIPIDDSAAPVTDDRGRIVGVVVAFRDIRERRLAENALRDAEAAVTQAQKMEAIGRLAGGVAHDFNNLLTVVTGNADLLARVPLGDADRALVTEIQDAGERATRLTRQLLTLSRKQVVKAVAVDLNAILSGAEAMLRRLIGDDIELIVDPAAGLPAILADPGQIEQVVMNMVVNARDAMPGGGTLTLATGTIDIDESMMATGPGDRPGRYVELSVSDTGIGMDEVTKTHLYEPFFTTKPAGRGTGLGLATVYGIVRQYDGHIAVHSEPGRGTTFWIHLPVGDAVAPAVADSDPSDPDPHGTETILLVEDQDAVRDTTSKMLEQFGYRVLAAPDADTAIRICERESIHVLVADVVLPGMNGRRLAELLAMKRPELRVLLLSGHTDDPVVRVAVSSGETAFLQKPFRALALARKIRSLLDRPPHDRGGA